PVMDSLMSLGSPLKQFMTSFSHSRRMSVGRRRSLPCTSQKVPDSWLRVYQDELKRERKRQQAILAKKNAERVVRKTQFRRQKPVAAAKDESFFGAFQGLSLDGLMGGSTAPVTTGANVDPCKVM
uniref:Uncharacterized protein n=1 Tax=Periophthalmus magnuspinnatus TaxID=409849 RepID=A0A3B3ZA56_9GOBI